MASGSDFGNDAATGNGGMNSNNLVAALASDATQVGTAFIAADAAKATVKANPAAATTLIIAAAGVAALVLIVFALRK